MISTTNRELREMIVETISKIGGHLGSSLGAAEVATALWIGTLHQVMNGTDMKAPPAPTMPDSRPMPLPTAAWPRLDRFKEHTLELPVGGSSRSVTWPRCYHSSARGRAPSAQA